MVAIVSAGKDFLPLFAKLREIGKVVIGIGGSRDNTAEVSIHSCDYYFYHEVLAQKGVPLLPPPAAPPGAGETGVAGSAAAGSAAKPADAPARSEAARLLVEALTVLGDNERVSLHTLGSTMRRMRPDFVPGAYGFKSLREVCLHAEAENLVTLVHGGDTTLVQARQKTATDDRPGLSSPALLRRWVERKLKVGLPSQPARLQLYRALAGRGDLGGGVPLYDLANDIAKSLASRELGKSVCYKLIYSLYRANSFLCRGGDDPYNPVILELGVSSEEAAQLDFRLLKNLILQYTREKAGEFVPGDWSRLFFDDLDHAGQIAELEQSL